MIKSSFLSALTVLFAFLVFANTGSANAVHSAAVQPAVQPVVSFRLAASQAHCPRVSNNKHFFLGWGNRTCAALASVGPQLVTNATITGFRSWKIDVVSGKVVRFVTSSPVNDNMLCSGSLAVANLQSCSDSRLTIATSPLQDSSDQFVMVPVPKRVRSDAHEVYLVAKYRLKGCSRFISAIPGCRHGKLRLVKKDDGTGLQRWIRSKIAVPSPVPSPAPSPVPSPVLIGGCAGVAPSLRAQCCVTNPTSPGCPYSPSPVPLPLPSPLPVPSPSPSPSPFVFPTPTCSGHGDLCSTWGLSCCQGLSCVLVPTYGAYCLPIVPSPPPPSPPPPSPLPPSPHPPPPGPPPSPPSPPPSPPLAAASTPGSPSPGITGEIYQWNTTWTDSVDLGYPTATFQIKCVAYNQPCNSTAVAESSAYPAGTQAGSVWGLTASVNSSTNYSCYIVATNSGVGQVCSSSATVVTMPKYPTVYIYHPDGRPWRRDTSSQTSPVKLNTNYSMIPIQLYASQSITNWQQGYIMFYVSNDTYLDTGGWYLHGQAGASQDNLVFYQNPNGSGYAIHTTDQNGWLGYSSSSDEVTLTLVPGYSTYNTWPPSDILLNWNVTPAPPTQCVKQLVVPSIPSAPAAGDLSVPLQWTTSWNDSSQLGSPEAMFKVVCVSQGSPCNSTALGQSSPIAAGIQKATFSLPSGQNYTCYTAVLHVTGEQCSSGTNISTMNVTQATAYNVSYPDGRSWRLDSSGNIKLNSGNITNVYMYNGSTITQSGYIAIYVDSGWLGTGSWYLHTGNHDNFLFYQANGSSGYAIYSTDASGAWLGYDNSSDEVRLVTVPLSNSPDANAVISTNWSITPAPPQSFIASLVAPSTPGAPAAGTVNLPTWTTTWNDSATVGNPPALFQLICVAGGSPCNATVLSKSSTYSAGTQSGSLTGLNASSTYDCYTLALHVTGTVCSSNTAITT